MSNTLLRDYICDNFDPIDEELVNEYEINIYGIRHRKERVVGKEAALARAVELAGELYGEPFEHNGFQIVPKGQFMGPISGIVYKVDR